MGAKEQSGRTLVFSLPGSRDNYNTSYNHYYNINLKPKVKTIAPTKYWRTLNDKNVEIITENTYEYLQPEKLSEFTKFLRFSKNQADLRNIGAFQKIRPIYKILALFKKSSGFTKYLKG